MLNSNNAGFKFEKYQRVFVQQFKKKKSDEITNDDDLKGNGIIFYWSAVG